MVRNKDGLTPFDLAAQNGHTEIENFLQQNELNALSLSKAKKILQRLEEQLSSTKALKSKHKVQRLKLLNLRFGKEQRNKNPPIPATHLLTPAPGRCILQNIKVAKPKGKSNQKSKINSLAPTDAPTPLHVSQKSFNTSNLTAEKDDNKSKTLPPLLPPAPAFHKNTENGVFKISEIPKLKGKKVQKNKISAPISTPTPEPSFPKITEHLALQNVEDQKRRSARMSKRSVHIQKEKNKWVKETKEYKILGGKVTKSNENKIQEVDSKKRKRNKSSKIAKEGGIKRKRTKGS